MTGPTTDCIAEPCTGDTWPEDWLIIDTPVGSFEVFMCEHHFEAFQAGTYKPASSVLRAVELVLSHPVMHGQPA